MKSIDWSSYAEVYDMIFEYNPAYQELVAKFQDVISEWEITPQASILDIGAGTGNFSLAAANRFSNNTVYHLDSDMQMNKFAKCKADTRKLTNIEFIHTPIESLDWSKFSNLQAVSCVHALYIMQNPQNVINAIYQALQPGGYVFLCNPGRILNITDWSKYFIKHLFQKHGFVATLQIVFRGRQIFKQNKIVRQLQLDGTYWTHSHEEFCDVVKNVGFKIIKAEKVFRDYSDLIVAIKLNKKV